MTRPPLGPTPGEPYDGDETVILTPAQIEEYARAVERARASRGQRSHDQPAPDQRSHGHRSPGHRSPGHRQDPHHQDPPRPNPPRHGAAQPTSAPDPASHRDDSHGDWAEDRGSWSQDRSGRHGPHDGRSWSDGRDGWPDDRNARSNPPDAWADDRARRGPAPRPYSTPGPPDGPSPGPSSKSPSSPNSSPSRQDQGWPYDPPSREFYRGTHRDDRPGTHSGDTTRAAYADEATQQIRPDGAHRHADPQRQPRPAHPRPYPSPHPQAGPTPTPWPGGQPGQSGQPGQPGHRYGDPSADRYGGHAGSGFDGAPDGHQAHAPGPRPYPGPAGAEPAGPAGTSGPAVPAMAGRHAARSEPAEEPSIGRSSRIMMVATAGSRLTGFLRSLAIASAIGFGFVGDAYNTANTLPNIVYELLLGGVLTSVIVPLLIHAQHEDEDGGEAYTQRLLSLSAVALAIASAIAMLAAPLLTALYVGSDSPKAHLTTIWAVLLLPEILFYGVGALFAAILNTRGVFGAPAWAPILNNLVVVVTAAVFVLMPGPTTLNPDTITTPQVLVLGVGTTLGIVAQALVLLPYLRRVGFRWKLRLDLRNSRLGEAGALSMWVVGYSAISAVGYLVQTRIANSVQLSGHSYAVFTNASLLFQMPYGILGVSLLTALMPRMSRAAARGDNEAVIADLSLGSRLSAVALLPVTALLIVLGPALGTVLYSLGRGGSGGGGHQVGVVLAMSAFGLVPFAITMLQLRVFYAMKDARTPTLINIGMVAAKVALSLPLPYLLDEVNLVEGLAVVNSLSFVIGAVVGEVVLRQRFGALDTSRVLRMLGRLTIASVVAVAVGFATLAAVTAVFGNAVAGSAVALVVGTAAMGAAVTLGALALRVDEISEMVGVVRRRTRRA